MSSPDLFGNPPESERLPSRSKPHDEEGYVIFPDDTGSALEEDLQSPRSFNGLTFAVFLAAVILSYQCFRLQIVQSSSNRLQAENNSIRILTVQPDRGLIEAMDGSVLAQNSRQLALAINPQALPTKKADREAIYRLLKEKTGLSAALIDSIESTYTKGPETFAIQTHLSKDKSLLYQEWFATTPGVVVQEIPIRSYSALDSLGQLLGYVGPATEDDLKAGHTRDQYVGRTGLEKQYDQPLAGKPGKERAEVNAAGETVRLLSSGEDSQPKTGSTLKLSLDSRLQGIVADALKHELDRRTKKFGEQKDLGASAVVLDPATGAIKAMVSLPDYDGNLFAQGISQKDYQTLLDNPANPLLNRTIQGQYPPGSTIKPLIAAGALQENVIDPNRQIYTPEAIFIGTFRFPDWKLHGMTDLRKAIAESNDIYFYALGGGWPDQHIAGLGIDRLEIELASFGLGSPVGVDLPGEAGGLLPTPSWKEQAIREPWYIGDTYHSSIGQGYTLTTPLQMATATAAIANGGIVWKPQLGWSLIDPAIGKETLLPHNVLKKDFISSKNIQVVREGMRQTVTSGSARPLSTLKVTSAGKTGTAEFGSKGLTHAWYTGFAPYDNPELAFAITIEGGGESFYSSVPVAEEILRGYFNEPLAPGQQLSASTADPGAFAGER